MRFSSIFGALLVFVFAAAFNSQATDDDSSGLKPEAIRYRNGDSVLYGCIYKPAGKGPFPAVVFNQASSLPSYEKIGAPPSVELAKFFTSHGYVFFLPGRFSHDSEKKTSPTANSEARVQWLQMHDRHNSDIIAAVNWLKGQSYVDETRLVLIGHSSGAIQTLLVSGIIQDFRGSIVFSPGALAWNSNAALSELLETAVSTAKTPVFLIQAQNDATLKPSEVLGNILIRRGFPNRVKVYPPYGDKPADAITLAVNGPSIWGNDVLGFMDSILK